MRLAVRLSTEPAIDRYPVLASAASGGLLVFAFPPFGFWPAAVLAVAMLSLIVHGRTIGQGAWYGWIFGLAFCIPVLHWAVTYVGAVGYLLGIVESLFFALMGSALAVVQRLPYWPAWSACIWVGQEAFRDRFPFGGFSWARLAFSQPQGPFLPYAAFGGAPLVTFAVALTGCLLARAFQAGLHRGQLKWIALAAAGVLEVPLIGLACGLAVQSGDSSPHVDIAVVQGNVPRLGLDFNAQREAVLRNHVNETLALARKVRAGNAPKPRVVIWPENSSDIDPLRNPDAAALIDKATKAIGAPILVGAILQGPGRHDRNAGIVWGPRSGPGQMYVKRHPVPFGEYIPWRSLARKVTDKVDLVPEDMVAGDTVGVLKMGGLRIGDVICFEIAYDGLVRSTVQAGAQIIATQTNNATFGRSGESPQQLAMARLRAVEHNRANLVASTSGISAVVAPDGTVLKQSEIFTAAAFDGPVPIQSGETVATRIGAIPEWIFTIVGAGTVLFVAALTLWERYRVGRRRQDENDTDEAPQLQKENA